MLTPLPAKMFRSHKYNDRPLKTKTVLFNSPNCNKSMIFHTLVNREFGGLTDSRFASQMLRVMKLTACILLFFALHVSAETSSQTITLEGKNLRLEYVFSVIKKQTGYNVLYDGNAIKDARPVTLDVVNVNLEAFLMQVFDRQPLQYSIKNTSIFVTKNTQDAEQRAADPFLLLKDSVPSLKTTGTVVDFNGLPLDGATIRVKGKSRAVMTDNMGRFTIDIVQGNTLIISFAGYTSVEEKVSTQRALLIKLEPSAILEETVVNAGYQKIKQKYLTGSVTSLRMDSLIQPGLSSIDKMLEGRVPGLTFMQNSGQSGAAPKLRIRGTNTFLGSREPLWVVDGIVKTNPFPIPAERINDPDFVNLLGNAVSGLNPYDIEQVDVLKDATAAALYGVRAANGVIVITTKRGKPGPPIVNYNTTATLTTRPRYTDRSMYMMDSRERVDVSREMIAKNLIMRGTVLQAYEKAILDYYGGDIDYASFRETVDAAESMNTDWLGATMRDAIASNHSLSVSGGNSNVSYRASMGYRTDPGVIKKEANKLYTGNLNMQMNYRKLKVDFNVQLNKADRRYTPSEIGILSYAYGTSRAVPLYNPDGSRYFYPKIGSAISPIVQKEFASMNILNEMDHTEHKLESNESNVSVDIVYEIIRGLQFRSKLAYTAGDANESTWFGEKSNWVMQARSNAFTNNMASYTPATDPLPFGGEYRKSFNKTKNYLVSSRLNFSRHLDRRQQHQLTMEAALDVLSNKMSSYKSTERGYYRDRGQSFANIDLVTHQSYRTWLQSNFPIVIEDVQNSIRPFLTATYIFNDRYVLTANTSQEFSNSFGDRSNEKFLPTWSISGRWNLHEDLLTNVEWIDRLALLVSTGSRGNMLTGQNPNAVISKGAYNAYYAGNTSVISSFPNPNLAWEKVQDYNGSLQFTLLKGRINGALGYFYNRTTNAFLQKKVSAINGITSYTVNGGTLENQGVEIDLNFKMIDNVGANKKRFLWRFDPQLGQVLNKIVNTNLNSRNILSDLNAITYQNYLDGTMPVNGKSVNTFYSYKFKQLGAQTGIPVFYGVEAENAAQLRNKYNAMTKEQVYAEIFTESGRREPVIQGSLNNSFVYGNWTMNVSMSYSLGNKIRLLKIASGNYGTFRPTSLENLRKEFVNRWQQPGDEANTNIPAIVGNVAATEYEKYGWFRLGSNSISTAVIAQDYYQMYDYSDIRVVSGDYAKLQYVSLSYRLEPEWCRKLNCKAAFISLSGNNLFTLTNKALRGQDPAQSGSAAHINLSIRPVYALNINISF